MKIPSIYIFCNNEEKNLQEDIVCLAQGLKDLKIPYYSNDNYWLESLTPKDYLIKKTPNIIPEDCDIIIFPYTWFYWIKEDEGIYTKKIVDAIKSFKGIKVCMDFHDGYKTFSFDKEFKIFDFIFRTKMFSNSYHPNNFHPWQLGITNRILQYVGNNIPFHEKKNEVLWNFGASHPYAHGLRTLAQKEIRPFLEKKIPINTTIDDLRKMPDDPFEALMWQQSVRRHNKAYYERLKENRFCATFCGELIPGLPYDPSIYLVGGKKAVIKKQFYNAFSKLFFKKSRVVQWDSWRFWEALAAGCIPIHIDLEKYGVMLPVMPQNWVHYIGIDLDNIEEDIDRIFSKDTNLEQISINGKKWVIDNYSPKVVAERFLNILGFHI